MRQYEAVIQAMEQLGGYAPLGQLYQQTMKVPGATWETKTPFASIRRIVQVRKEFFKIRPGLWALESHREKLPDPLKTGRETKAKSQEVQLFDHTYYQGLLVQIGNLHRYKTYVPSQDKNKKFLGKNPLADFVFTTRIYPFTYSEIVSKVKSIDVIWFNEAEFPKSVFEIEHSTDIKNSLIKFVELQDFRTEMKIVADERRRKQFESIVNSRAFHSIKNYVRFTGYQEIALAHTRSFLRLH